MLELNEKTKESITKRIGIERDELSKMSAKEIDQVIEKKIGKKLELKLQNVDRMPTRGSVYTYLQRFLK